MAFKMKHTDGTKASPAKLFGGIAATLLKKSVGAGLKNSAGAVLKQGGKKMAATAAKSAAKTAAKTARKAATKQAIKGAVVGKAKSVATNAITKEMEHRNNKTEKVGGTEGFSDIKFGQ